MPPLDVATTSQAVPLFSKARFLGNANRAYWYFVVESFPSSHHSLDDGHRQWPSGIEGLPVFSPASLFLSGLLILPRGTLSGR